jgi:hypothetical protein
VRLGEQPVEVGERAKRRVDAGEVRDVVAEIRHRRGIDRGQPDGVDAKPTKIVEPVDDAGQIADAIAVAVLKRARVDLIDDPVRPPGLTDRGGHCQRRRRLRKTGTSRPRSPALFPRR